MDVSGSTHEGEPLIICRIATTDHDASTVVAVSGDMDYESVALIRAAVDAALLRLDGRMLVLDLTAVDFLGSAGISALVDVARAAIEAGGERRRLRVVVDHARAVIRP